MPRTINEELAERETRDAPEAATPEELSRRVMRSPVLRLTGIAGLAVLFLFFFLWHLIGGFSLGVALVGAGGAALFSLLGGKDEDEDE